MVFHGALASSHACLLAVRVCSAAAGGASGRGARLCQLRLQAGHKRAQRCNLAAAAAAAALAAAARAVAPEAAAAAGERRRGVIGNRRRAGEQRLVEQRVRRLPRGAAWLLCPCLGAAAVRFAAMVAVVLVVAATAGRVAVPVARGCGRL